MAQLNFNAATVQPDAGRADPIPAGWYNAMMEASEMKPTKNGGAYLECKYKVVDGQYAGRVVYGRINLQNSNPQAVEIGYRQLSAIAHAVGHLQVGDSSELHNKPLKIKVKLQGARQERDPQTGETKDYEASNDIVAYRNVNDQTVGNTAPAAAAAPQAPVGLPHAGPAGWPQQPPQAPQFAQPQMPAQQPPQFAPPPMQQPQQQWQQPNAQQPWPQPGQPAPMQQQPVPQQPQQPPMQPPMAPPGFAAPQQPAANAGYNPQGAMPPWAVPQQPAA